MAQRAEVDRAINSLQRLWDQIELLEGKLEEQGPLPALQRELANVNRRLAAKVNDLMAIAARFAGKIRPQAGEMPERAPAVQPLDAAAGVGGWDGGCSARTGVEGVARAAACAQCHAKCPCCTVAHDALRHMCCCTSPKPFALGAVYLADQALPPAVQGQQSDGEAMAALPGEAC